MAGYAEVLDLMRPMLGGSCLDVSLRWAALQATRRLCQTSRCYQRSLHVSAAAGYTRYQVTLADWLVVTDAEETERDNAEILGIKELQVGCDPYVAAGPASFRDSSGRDVAVYYPPDQFEIFAVPTRDVVDGIKVQTILRPKLGATELPAMVIALYAEQIARGAVGMLKLQPNEAWSDPAYGAALDSQFRTDVALATADADRQYRARGFRVKAYP